MPSFILIHPTVWPQYTNVTDRQIGQKQRTDSIGRTVLQTVAQKAKAQEKKAANSTAKTKRQGSGLTTFVPTKTPTL